MKQNLHAAFSFLTILLQGKEYTNSTMQKSVYYYPLVGAVIFFISACLSLLFLALINNYFFSALIFLLSDCILIRGLHHDGLADIVDAMGSGKRKEEFRIILKDSRIGSFGVLALIFYFLFAASLLSQLLEMNAANNNTCFFLLQMLFVGLWSRLGLLAFPVVSELYEPGNQKISLAKILFANFKKEYFFYWFVFLFFSSTLCFNTSLIIMCTSFSFLFTFPLYKIAQRENGFNGDFLGANCLLWELAGFLSLVLFYQL